MTEKQINGIETSWLSRWLSQLRSQDAKVTVSVAVSVVGVFTAASYILGRLRTEAYYSALGIAPGLLSLGPNDYMFASVDLVIICAMASFYLYLYYYATKQGATTKQGKIAKLRTYMVAKLRTDMVLWIPLAGVILWMLYSRRLIYLPGITGILIGAAVGISLLLYIDIVSCVSINRKLAIRVVILGFLGLIAWLPSIASNLAGIEAMADIPEFPKAVITCEKALDPQLQSSLHSQNRSVEVGVITANNDMTYVLKQGVDSEETWQVYAIPSSDIKTIVFAGNSS